MSDIETTKMRGRKTNQKNYIPVVVSVNTSITTSNSIPNDINININKDIKNNNIVNNNIVNDNNINTIQPNVLNKKNKKNVKNNISNNLNAVNAVNDKKNIILAEAVEVEEEKEYDIDNDFNEDGSMKTKRRGRKPKDKFKYETTDLDEYQRNNKKDENVIIKLPLSCLKLNEEFNLGKDLFPYNPIITTPKPYNPEDLMKGNIGFSLLNDNDGNNIDNNEYIEADNNINTNDNSNNDNKTCLKCKNCTCNGGNITGIETINSSNISGNKNQLQEGRQIDIILNNKYYTNTDKFNVLTHLGNSMNGDKWPEKTDIPCLWECHTFKNTPWGVPYKFTNNKFQLFGNFCSSNCVLAYILQNYQDDDALWEKVALLNLLNFKVNAEYKSIVPSFDKMALKLFGGTLEIEEFRNITSVNDKAYSIEFPPCNTIIPMLEEIYKKTNLNNTFIPVDKNRIQTANNELKLKRSKPVVNHKNTLDFCLGKT